MLFRSDSQVFLTEPGDADSVSKHLLRLINHGFSKTTTVNSFVGTEFCCKNSKVKLTLVGLAVGFQCGNDGCHPRDGAPVTSSPVPISSSMATDSPSDPMGLDAPVGLLRPGLSGMADEDAAAVPAADLATNVAGAREGVVDAAAAESPVTGVVMGVAAGGVKAIGARFPIVGAKDLGSGEMER